MAKRIKAVGLLRPRIQRRLPPSIKELDDFFSGNGSFPTGSLYQYSARLAEMIARYLGAGRSVKIPYVGLFFPDITTSGKFVVKFRPDPSLVKIIDAQRGRMSHIKNREYLGASLEQLCEAWNALHPEDPVDTDS